jgi:hypothetical protein
LSLATEPADVVIVGGDDFIEYGATFRYGKISSGRSSDNRSDQRAAHRSRKGIFLFARKRAVSTWNHLASSRTISIAAGASQKALVEAIERSPAAVVA